MSKVNVLGVQMWEGEEERERMRLEEKMIRECLNQMVIQGKSMLIAVILFYFGRLFLLPAVLSPPKSMTLIVIQRLPISFLF